MNEARPPSCSYALAALPFPLSSDLGEASTFTPLSLRPCFTHHCQRTLYNPVKLSFLQNEMGPPWPKEPAPPYPGPASVLAFPSLPFCT